MIPADLRAERRWITWRYVRRDGAQVKLPICVPSGRPNGYLDPANWVAFDDVARLPRKGFVLGDGWAGVDLDDCVDGGRLTPAARAIVDRLDSYTEISPSGRGVKTIVRVMADFTHARDGFEVYSRRRFFTVTGNHLAGMPTAVAIRHDAVAALVAEHGGDPEPRDWASPVRFAYPGLDVAAFLAAHVEHLRLVTDTDTCRKWTFRCPFDPKHTAPGSAFAIEDPTTANVVAGCLGARCRTGYGLEDDRGWQFRDLLRFHGVDPDDYETRLDEPDFDRPSPFADVAPEPMVIPEDV